MPGRESLVKYLKYVGLGTLMMIGLTYILGWFDLINNKMLTGNWLKDFPKSIAYYVQWVLPYWWLIILTGGGFIVAIIIAVRAALRRF